MKSHKAFLSLLYTTVILFSSFLKANECKEFYKKETNIPLVQTIEFESGKVGIVNLSYSNNNQLEMIESTIKKIESLSKGIPFPNGTRILLQNYTEGKGFYKTVTINPNLADASLYFAHEFTHAIFYEAFAARWPQFKKEYQNGGLFRLYLESVYSHRRNRGHEVQTELGDLYQIQRNGEAVDSNQIRILEREQGKLFLKDSPAEEKFFSISKPKDPNSTISKLIELSTPYQELLSDFMSELSHDSDGNRIAQSLKNPKRSFLYPESISFGETHLSPHQMSHKTRTYLWRLLQDHPDLKPIISSLVLNASLKEIEYRSQDEKLENLTYGEFNIRLIRAIQNELKSYNIKSDTPF